MNRKRNIIIGISIFGVLLLIGAVYVIIAMFGGDPAAGVREQYGRQKAGIGPGATPAATPPLVILTPSPAPPTSGGSSGAITLDPGYDIVPGPQTSAPTADFYVQPVGPGVVMAGDQPRVNTDPALNLPNPVYQTPPVPDPLYSQNVPPTTGEPGLSGRAKSVVTPKRYLFNNRSAAALEAKPIVFGAEQTAAADIRLDTFAPEGETVELVIVEKVESNNTEVAVKAAVWVPFYFQGNLLLEPGTELLGKAAPGKRRDRLTVKWDKIVFKSGKSLPISAVALGADGSEGIQGYIVGNLILQSMTPILLEMSAAMIDTLKDRSLQALIPNVSGSVAIGTVTATDSSPKKQIADAGLSAMQGGLEKISQLVAQDVEENKPFLVVPPGTRCKAYLQRFVDVSQADYGK